jgi:uncharacterized protein (DUF924 family)
MTDAEAVLRFWFGANPDDPAVGKAQAGLWWSKTPEIDDEIRRRFEDGVRAAAAGELAHWAATPRGRLALMILTDQFPRNIYRGTARAFAYDAQALTWCLDGLDRRFDLRLRPIERMFFYLPLEHAESLAHQERAVRCFEDLFAAVPAEQQNTFQEYLDFARRHREVIACFGRFPHRNKILGRQSTSDELAFLAQPGSSF